MFLDRRFVSAKYTCIQLKFLREIAFIHLHNANEVYIASSRSQSHSGPLSPFNYFDHVVSRTCVGVDTIAARHFYDGKLLPLPHWRRPGGVCRSFLRSLFSLKVQIFRTLDLRNFLSLELSDFETRNLWKFQSAKL